MTFDPNKPVRLPLRTEPSSRDQTGTKDAKLINGYQERQPGDGDTAIFKRPGYALFPAYNASGVSGVGAGLHYSATQLRAFQMVVAGGNTLGYNAITGAFLGIAAATVSGCCFFADYAGGTFGQVVQGYGQAANFFTIDTTVTGRGGPAVTCCPGVVYLDGTIYMMDLVGRIWGSAINDPATWPGTNFIQSSTYSTQPVFLARQKVYVIAFSAFETNVFFDAGNSTGSPLSPLPGGKAAVGCFDPFSVQTMGDEMVWVGQIANGIVGVYLMRDLRIKKVSTGAIDRILSFALSAQTTVFGSVHAYFTSWQTSVEGHRFYVLNLLNQSFSLVLDLDTGDWYEWQLDAGGLMPFFTSGNLPAAAGVPTTVNFGVLTNGQGTVVQGTDGRAYLFDNLYYNDNGNPFTLTLVTENWDGGTRYKKYLNRIDFDVDQQPGSTLSVSYTEDDYQTYSTPRTVDLSVSHPYLINCGTFRRRAYKLTHSAQTPLRLYSMNMNLQIGSK